MKSKTRPPELIFVVLNFVALDDHTCHAPFAIERKPSNDRHQSDRNREISSLILRLMVEDIQQDGEMPCIRSQLCAHSRQLFSRRPLPTVTNFHGVQNFVTVRLVTKITKMTRYTVYRKVYKTTKNTSFNQDCLICFNGVHDVQNYSLL